MSEAWVIQPDEESSAGLLAVLDYMIDEKKAYSAEELERAMAAYGHPACVPSHDTIRRFRKKQGKAKLNQFFLANLYYFIGEKVYRTPAFFKDLAGSEEFLRRCRDYFARFSGDKVFRRLFLPTKHVISPDTVKLGQVIRKANDDLGLPNDSWLHVAPELFSAAELQQARTQRIFRFFATYRYSSRVGLVDKSLTRISYHQATSEHVKFENVLRDDNNNIRSTDGYVLHAKGKIYFIGGIDSGYAMKFMGFSKFQHTSETVTGLLMSIGTAGHIICSRVLLRHIPTELSMEQIKPYRDKEIETQDGVLLTKIANKIDFGLQEQLLFRGRPISQSNMVAEVEKILIDEQGNSLFRFTDGRDFNPATSRHYTFNSCLPEYNDNE